MGFHPLARRRLLKQLFLFVILALIVASLTWWRGDQLSNNSQIATPSPPSSAPQASTAFDTNQYSVNDPASLWAVVNKGRALPSDYVPADLVVPNVDLSESAGFDNMHLRKDVAVALEKLTSVASDEGVKLMLVSGYRSYTTQQSVYNGYVSSQGKAYADATSAQPGHSEHQTGLAADLGAASGKCQLDACFGNTAEGKWLAANAYKYGFIVRYPKGKTDVTGYAYEPWHLRYLGVDLAAQISNTGQTLEQFFVLTTYTDYPTQIYKLTK